ncbi:hypothetical protein ACHAXT_008963 [Thalassiosira profunda]
MNSPRHWVCLLALGLSSAPAVSFLTNCNAPGALMGPAAQPQPAAFATSGYRRDLLCNPHSQRCRTFASTAAFLEEPPVVNATSPRTDAAGEDPEAQAGSTAVILNMNARSVTPPMASIATELFGEGNVFVTRTAEEAKLAARTVVRGCEMYSLVVPVGGDGTLSGWINTMVDEMMLYHKLEGEGDENGSANATDSITVEEAVKQLPLLGYIPMGTGNGLGYVIGCKASDKNGNKVAKRSLLSRVNVFAMMKRRKLERARQTMQRLKEVGDAAARYAEDHAQQPSMDAVSGLCSIVEMPLMEVTHPSEETPGTDNGKGDLCFFAGAGFDSLMLEDFKQIKAWSKTTKRAPAFIKDALSSVAGYCVALVAKTLPQTVQYGTHRIHVEVTTGDAETLWVDHRRGDFSELAVRPGSRNGVNASDGTAPKRHLVYSGSTGIIAAATTPYYGGGLRLFPYARLIPGRLQLRLGRISPLTGFLNVLSIFAGSYRDAGERSFGCLDFIGREFEVEVRSGQYEEYVQRQQEKAGVGKRRRWLPWRRQKDEPANDQERGEGRRETTKGFPFQHSGESMGIKERFCLRAVEEPVKFVSFLQPRVVVDD